MFIFITLTMPKCFDVVPSARQTFMKHALSTNPLIFLKVFQFWCGTKSNFLRFICSLRWSKFTGTQGMASKLGIPSPKEKVVRQLRGFFEVLETQVCIALSLKQVRPWVYLLYPSRPSGAMLRIWKPRFRGYSEFWVYRVARAKPESSLWWWILW